MPLTRDFRETVKARAERDPGFRAGLYRESVQAMLDGEWGTAKILLRDFINATMIPISRALNPPAPGCAPPQRNGLHRNSPQ